MIDLEYTGTIAKVVKLIKMPDGGTTGGAFEIPAPFADAAAQLQGAFEDGAAQLMDLPGAIQAGITSLASQFPAELPSFPV